MRGTILIICSLLLLIAGGFWLERSVQFEPMKHALQSQTVPTAILNYGPMGKILKQLAMIKAVPNDHSRFPASVEGQNVDIQASIFQKKRQVGQYLYCVNHGGMAEFPSSQVIKSEYFRDGWPLISITADHNDLYSYKTGIAAKKGRIPPYGRSGRKWERFAHVSYYEHGKLVFATGAGLRTHGGIAKSFRLYFRDDYGADQFKPGVFSDSESHPIKRLVVHDDRPHSLHFTTSLAFDIARQIGCVVPEAKPVIFFLNGKLQGLYWISEHVSRKQWESHFKHEDFRFLRYKGPSNMDSRRAYVKLRKWSRNPNTKMTMEELGKYVDIDNLTRHLFSFAFCGTTDWKQGAMLQDKSYENARWFWVNWDMDQSFLDYSSKGRKRELWEQEALGLIINRDEMRSTMVSRLLREDHRYGKYFVKLMIDLLNHKIDPDYLNSRVDYYEQMARSYSMDTSSLEKQRRFMKYRPDFIRKQIGRLFGLGVPMSCQLKGPAGSKYEIDGYPEGPDYKGSYFKGLPVTVKVEKPPKHKQFSHWLVNGKKIDDHDLTFPLFSDTIVQSVFK